MARVVPSTINVEPPKIEEGNWIKRFYDALNKITQATIQSVNGNISFGNGTNLDNINGSWVNATSVAGNFTITHNLGRIPAGWIMVNTDAFENLKFISSTATQMVLAGQNGGAHIRLFII